MIEHLGNTTQIKLSCFGNLSSVVTADPQMPAQLTLAPSAVAIKKPHTAGEEQTRTRTQGEAPHKQYNISEYSNPFT